MAIVRGPRPTGSYAMISNEMLQDPRLSYRARGVAAAILSRPEGWRTDSVTLAAQGREGRDAIRSAMNELEKFEYSCLVRSQGPDGRWANDRYVFDRVDDMRVFQAQRAEEAVA